MADYLTTDTELTSIASAIRTKGGTSDPLTYPAGFVSAIEAIPTGGGGTTHVITNLASTGCDTLDSTLSWSDTNSEFAEGELVVISTDPANRAFNILRADTSAAVTSLQICNTMQTSWVKAFIMPDCNVYITLR